MRRVGELVWIAVGFAAGTLGAEYLLPFSGLPYFAAALAVICLIAVFAVRGQNRNSFLLLLLSAAVGLVLWRGYYDRHVAPCEALAGQELTVAARVTDYPAETGNARRVAVKITSGAPKEPAWLYFTGGGAEDLVPGDMITVTVETASVMEIRGRRAHTCTAAGKHLVGYVRGEAEVTGRAACSWIYFPLTVSRGVKRLCRSLFPENTAGFMQALLTGDKSLLAEDETLYGNMRIAGVLHIVAVSGMHISILAGFIETIFGRGRGVRLFCLPVIWLFVLAAGAGASAVRAAVMQTAVLLAPLTGRERDGPASLSAALLLLLLPNPMAVAGVGLQLSFASVLGFEVIGPPLGGWMREHLPMKNRAVRFAARNVSATVCATAFSLPLSAAYFGAIPLFAALSNLLTLPAVTFCFAMGYVICAVGAVFPAAGAALGYGLSVFARWCAWVYKTVAAVPFAGLYTAVAAVAIWLALVYAMAIVWLLLRRRGVRITPVIPVEVGVIGLCAALLAGGLSLNRGGALSVLDVGQGQCVVLTDESASVVIDCGGNGADSAGDTAADWLLSRGRTRVNALVLTHLHADHTNGAATLLRRMPVDYLLLPSDAEDGDEMLPALLAAAEETDTAVVYVEREMTAAVGGMELTLLLPQAGSDENERGVAVLAEFPEGSALIMGDGGVDAEMALLARQAVPDVDVLVAGHHGSKTASGLLFLRTALPETAVISVGYNSYGHPAAETLERLEECGAAILRTDEDGTVTIPMKATDEVYG